MAMARRRPIIRTNRDESGARSPDSETSNKPSAAIDDDPHGQADDADSGGVPTPRSGLNALIAAVQLKASSATPEEAFNW